MATTRRGKPAVVRLCAPDEEAKAAAVRLLMERTTAKPRPTPNDERQSSNS